jgi:hypothetical protein
VYRFLFIQYKLDGTLLGVVEVYSRSKKTDEFSGESETKPDKTTYYYSVLLSQTECRVSELIRQFNEEKNIFDGPYLNDQFQVIYRRHQTDLYIFSIYEVFATNEKPEMREILTLDYPELLRGMVANGKYVVAYPGPFAKEKGSIYVRNLVTDTSKFLELPGIVRRDCMLNIVGNVFCNNIHIIAGRSTRDSQIHLCC